MEIEDGVRLSKSIDLESLTRSDQSLRKSHFTPDMLGYF